MTQKLAGKERGSRASPAGGHLRSSAPVRPLPPPQAPVPSHFVLWTRRGSVIRRQSSASLASALAPFPPRCQPSGAGRAASLGGGFLIYSVTPDPEPLVCYEEGDTSQRRLAYPFFLLSPNWLATHQVRFDVLGPQNHTRALPAEALLRRWLFATSSETSHCLSLFAWAKFPFRVLGPAIFIFSKMPSIKVHFVVCFLFSFFSFYCKC